MSCSHHIYKTKEAEFLIYNSKTTYGFEYIALFNSNHFSTFAKKAMSKTHLLQVKAVERLTEESVVLTFDVPESVKGSFQYLPGQYVSLETTTNGETVRRSYSLCSSPHSGLLQVGIKEVSQGLFSTYANQKLSVGETLKVGLPEGRFTLDTEKVLLLWL